MAEQRHDCGSPSEYRAEWRWLLVKVDDERADRRRRPTPPQPESALSGRSNEDL